MVFYVSYKTATGEITRTGTADPEEFIKEDDESTLIVPVRHPSSSTYMVLAGQLTERPTLMPPDKTTIQADDTDAATFPFIPQGSEIFIDENLYGTMDDSEQLQYTSGIPGPKRIRIQPEFPVVPLEVVIEAV